MLNRLYVTVTFCRGNWSITSPLFTLRTETLFTLAHRWTLTLRLRKNCEDLHRLVSQYFLLRKKKLILFPNGNGKGPSMLSTLEDFTVYFGTAAFAPPATSHSTHVRFLDPPLFLFFFILGTQVTTRKIYINLDNKRVSLKGHCATGNLNTLVVSNEPGSNISMNLYTHNLILFESDCCRTDWGGVILTFL